MKKTKTTTPADNIGSTYTVIPTIDEVTQEFISAQLAKKKNSPMVQTRKTT